MASGADLVKCFMRAALSSPAMKNMSDAQAGQLQAALMNGNTAEAKETIRLAMQPQSSWGRFIQRFQSLRDAGLLSGPATALTKGLSDSVFQLMRDVERTVVSPTEGRYAMQAHISSLGQMVKIVKDGLTGDPGFDLANPEETLKRISPFKGAFGKVVSYPYQAIGAFDKGARYTAGRTNLAQLAARQGMHEGLHGLDLDSYVQKAMDSNGDSIPGIADQVAKAVLRDTYNAKLPIGGIAAHMASMSATNPFIHFILPFVKVPYNIAKEGFIRTPLGFGKVAYDALKNGMSHEELLDELVKPMMGTAIMAGMGTLAYNGYITGGGPADHREYSNKLKTGWQPYSVKAGDTYISYHRLEPMATLLGGAADMVEGWKGADKAKTGEIMQKALQSIQANLTGKTYLTGMENFFGAIHDPKGAFPSWVKSMQGSLVPAIVGRTAQAVDPTLRETHAGDLSPIEARIPGLSKSLPPALSPLGQPQTRDESPVARGISAYTPFNISHDKSAPVEAELDRLGMAPPAPGKTFTQGKLKAPYSPDEYREIEQKSGAMAYPQLQALIQSEGYENLPDEYKEKLIHDITTQAHTAARLGIRGKVLQRLRGPQKAEAPPNG